MHNLRLSSNLSNTFANRVGSLSWRNFNLSKVIFSNFQLLILPSSNPYHLGLNTLTWLRQIISFLRWLSTFECIRHFESFPFFFSFKESLLDKEMQCTRIPMILRRSSCWHWMAQRQSTVGDVSRGEFPFRKYPCAAAKSSSSEMHLSMRRRTYQRVQGRSRTFLADIILHKIVFDFSFDLLRCLFFIRRYDLFLSSSSCITILPDE